MTVEHDPALHIRAAPRQQPHHCECRHRFAGAGLADEGDDLAATNVVADAAHGMDRAACAVELDAKISNAKKGLAVGLVARLGLQDHTDAHNTFSRWIIYFATWRADHTTAGEPS